MGKTITIIYKMGSPVYLMNTNFFFAEVNFWQIFVKEIKKCFMPIEGY